MFKKLFLITILSLGLFNIPIYAEDIPVYINGTRVNFDEQPITQNDRTLVPMRAIFEAFGYEITWDDTKQAVSAVQKEDSGFFSTYQTYDIIYLTIGSNIMQIGKTQYLDFGFVNQPVNTQKEKVPLDCTPVLVNDRVYVPLRAISEAIGAKVEWRDSENAVYITASDTSVKMSEQQSEEVSL